MTDRAILGVYHTRRKARRVERQLQQAIDNHEPLIEAMPDWANGVRVQKAGMFQWAVVWTERHGH